MNPTTAVVLVIVVLLVAGGLGLYLTTEPVTASQPDLPVQSNVPARGTNITDCGYPSEPRGWYDILGRGAKNDFCRYTDGLNGSHKFSCWIAGKNESDWYDTPYDPAAAFEPYVYRSTDSGWSCK